MSSVPRPERGADTEQVREEAASHRLRSSDRALKDQRRRLSHALAKQEAIGDPHEAARGQVSRSRSPSERVYSSANHYMESRSEPAPGARATCTWIDVHRTASRHLRQQHELIQAIPASDNARLGQHQSRSQGGVCAMDPSATRA